MARIPSTTFKDWKDGDIVNAEEYERELQIIRAAVNDNHDRITTLQSVSGGSISRIPHGTAFPTVDIQPGQIFFRSDQELFYLLGLDMQWEPFAPKSVLDAHTLNDDNPHNVSASQVGAYTKTETDNGFVKTTGAARIENVPGFFFTNGSSNQATATVTFAKPFVSQPAVYPGNITQSVSYGDTLQHPYIYNVTTTGFQCKIIAAGPLGSATPTNLIMNFIAVGN